MKKIFTLSILTLMSLFAMADDQGTCGENLTWTFVESTGTLTISGTGPMDDYTLDTPWHTHEESILTVEVGEGATTIGMGAFILAYNMTSASIPGTVTSIGEGAFSACASMTAINIPFSVQSIDKEAFMGCLGLTTIIVEATTPPTLGDDVFLQINDNAKIYVPAGTVDAYKSSWNDYANMIVESDPASNVSVLLQDPGEQSSAPVKVIHNGQLLIDNYSVSGQRVK